MQRSQEAVDEPSDEGLVGATVGHFEIRAVLGRGGMGVVYRAQDLLLDRPVALKMLAPEVVRVPERRRALLEEARAAARAGCPEVAAIHEVQLDERAPFVAMELVEGQTLRERLRAGPLPVEAALDVALQIARALAVMHGRGVLHRDLKPENVMVGPGGRAKVLDFGLARALAPGDDGRTPAPDELARVASGTPGYAAPEQQDGRLVDARVDVFAFGAVLHELLTGEPAVPRHRAGALGLPRFPDPPPSPRARVPAVPEALDRLVRRCLSVEREGRPPDGEALLEALERLAGTTSRSRGGAGSADPCPAPLPPGGADARALFAVALALARRHEAGFLGVEHLALALRESSVGGALAARLRAALAGGEELWTPGALLGTPPSGEPRLTPRLCWWAGFLDADFDVEQLLGLLCADPDHHLHLLTRQDLGARLAGGADPWATLTGAAFVGAAAAPVLALEVLRGPEDGRVLPLQPEDTLGRWSPDSALTHALYVGTTLQDPALSRQALHWRGEGRARLRKAGRLLRGGERLSVPPGELALHAGDVLQLTPGTWLRALDRAHLELRTVPRRSHRARERTP